MEFIAIATLWVACATAYAGGIIFGLRFLRRSDLVDTRPCAFMQEAYFGQVGINYRRFYHAFGSVHGYATARLLIILHLVSSAMVFVLPIFSDL